MRNGRRIEPPPSLEALRVYVRDALAQLPATVRDLTPSGRYTLSLGRALSSMAGEFRRAAVAAQD